MFNNLLNGVDRGLAVRLALFHILVIAVSNWLVTYKFSFFGNPLTYAAFTFPLVIVATDLTVRMVGKETGRLVVALAYIPAVLASIGVILLEGAPTSVALRIGFASGTAYLVGTLLDVYVFQYIREQYTAWWAAPALSTVVANFIDTYTFFYVGFAGGDDAFMAANWSTVAFNQTISKMLVGLIVFLPVYGLVLNYIQRKIKA